MQAGAAHAQHHARYMRCDASDGSCLLALRSPAKFSSFVTELVGRAQRTLLDAPRRITNCCCMSITAPRASNAAFQCCWHHSLLCACVLHTSCPAVLQAVCHLSPAGQAPHFASDCISGVAFADDGSQVLANYLGKQGMSAASCVCRPVHVSVQSPLHKLCRLACIHRACR